MTATPSIEIKVDVLDQLALLLWVYGVYALLVLFMFVFERRANRDFKDASKAKDEEASRHYRREHTVVLTLIICLTVVVAAVWIYTNVYQEERCYQGSFAGLVSQTKEPANLGDPPQVIDTIRQLQAGDKFFTYTHEPGENHLSDLDWVLMTAAHQKTILLIFRHKFASRSSDNNQAVIQARNSPPVAIISPDSTASSAPLQPCYLQKMIAINLKTYPELQRQVIQMNYQADSSDPCKVGRLVMLDVDHWVDLPMSDIVAQKAAPSGSSRQGVAWFGAKAAWAESLPRQDAGGKLSASEAASLLADLGSQNVERQLAASKTLTRRGVPALDGLAQALNDRVGLKVENRALLVHNLAEIDDRLEGTGQAAAPAFHEALARASYDSGDLQLTLKHLNALPASVKKDTSLLMIKGSAEAGTGAYPLAVETFKELIAQERDPTQRSVAFSNIGGVYLKQGQYDISAKSLYEAIKLDPENRAARFNLASLDLTRGNLTGAAAGFREVIRRDTHNTGAKILLAVTYQRKGELGTAEEMLKDVLQESPDNAVALNNLAYLYALQGVNLERASVLAERALKVNGNNASFLDTRAWILHLQHRDQDALRYLRQAHQAAPDDQVIKSHLGVVARAK